MNTSKNINEFNQPLGNEMSDWVPRNFPNKENLIGKFCILEKVDKNKHFNDLYDLFGPASDPRTWTYLSLTGFHSREDFWNYLIRLENNKQEIHYAILDKTDKRVLGSLALVEIDQENGSVEVGYVIYSDELKRTRMATEAQFLLMKYVFDELGYRRYVWMSDTLNEASKKAAKRLGFSSEGTFRNMWVYKGRNRDTAWFSMTDHDWITVKKNIERWLEDSNFDVQGNQESRLINESK